MDRMLHPELMRELELRVTDGPQVGASAPLPPGAGCVIAAGGDGVDADIVLRGDPKAPARVRVTAALPHALLEVLQGEVQVDGQRLAAGAQTVWAMHVPLAIGGSTLVFAPVGEEAVPGAAPSTPDAPIPARPPRRRAELW